eukprot:TRINITY_DN40_c0_g1_i2.p1 TRINITY_DN40_c0_g1~~TRINITY_DN40_c0_g1_i2.p1  ORF type:complete len:386 (-),score=66.53 TRINITY_DN40_c0_g1_i2:647-1804(-)
MAREPYFPATDTSRNLRWCYRLGKKLYMHVTSKSNTITLTQSRGPGFAVPHMPPPGVDPPTSASVVDEIREELCREDAEELVFAGWGEPTLALGTVLDVAAGLRSMGKPIRLVTNGLASLHHSRDVLPELAAAGVSDVTIGLNAAHAAQHKLWVSPIFWKKCPGVAFNAACEFVRSCAAVLGAAHTEVTCVASPGVNVEAVEMLSRTLGAGHFRERSFHCRHPSAGFAAHEAAFAGDLERLAALPKSLLKGLDDVGNTPAIWAAEAGRTMVLRVLIEQEGCSVDTPGLQGNTALQRAVTRGHVDAVRLLLTDLRADPNVYNAKQQTPLHQAAFNQHPEIVRALLAAGGNTKNLDAKGRVPMDDTSSEQIRIVFADWALSCSERAN